MKEKIPFVVIPKKYVGIVGEPDPGSRLFKAVGTREDLIKWIAIVDEICGDQGNVSPGGAAAIAGVTRAAVHKRLKEGRLTGFCFYVVKTKKLIVEIKYLEELGRANICDIPVSECVDWAKSIDLRKSTKTDLEENEVSKKDQDDTFMKAPKNWRKMR